MRLTRIDRTLEDCEKHLLETKSFGTEIEKLLTYTVLVIIYAEFEQEIKSIVQQRCNLIKDESLRDLAVACLNVSRIKSSDIAELLKRFGSQRKDAFRAEIKNSVANQRAETFYNNIIANRHDTAHSIGSNLGFQEVKEFYQEGHVVIDFFKRTLFNGVL